MNPEIEIILSITVIHNLIKFHKNHLKTFRVGLILLTDGQTNEQTDVKTLVQLVEVTSLPDQRYMQI